MSVSRRAALALPMLLCGRPAAAADIPTRPLRLVVPFAGGTSTDIIGRLIAGHLSAGLGGATVVVDNRPGAGGTIGSQAVAQAPPDGNAFLLGTIGTHAVNPHLMPNLGYDPERDFTPIIAHSKTKLLLVVRPALGPRGMAEFLALARRRPLSVGTSGTGAAGHLAQALMTEATGVETTHVPYRDAGRAMTDLLSGTLDAMFYHTQFVRPHIEAGSILGLGITGAGRSALLPTVPTFAEAGLSQISIEAWWAVYGPPRLPPPITARVNAILDEALRQPETAAAMDRNGVEPMGGPPAALVTLQHAELALWREVVRRAGITAEG